MNNTEQDVTLIQNTLAEVRKLLCTSLSDAHSTLGVLLEKFPELQGNSLLKNECVGKLCYVSDVVNFRDDFNKDIIPENFIKGLLREEIFREVIVEYNGSVEYCYKTEENSQFRYAIPCDKVKLIIGDNQE